MSWGVFVLSLSPSLDTPRVLLRPNTWRCFRLVNPRLMRREERYCDLTPIFLKLQKVFVKRPFLYFPSQKSSSWYFTAHTHQSTRLIISLLPLLSSLYTRFEEVLAAEEDGVFFINANLTVVLMRRVKGYVQAACVIEPCCHGCLLISSSTGIQELFWCALVCLQTVCSFCGN